MEGMEERHGREGCCPLEGSLAAKQEGSWGRGKPQQSFVEWNSVKAGVETKEEEDVLDSFWPLSPCPAETDLCDSKF